MSPSAASISLWSQSRCTLKKVSEPGIVERFGRVSGDVSISWLLVSFFLTLLIS